MTKFSDDKGSVKNERITMVWIWTDGSRVRRNSFNLTSIGEVSDPIKTMYGWYLIKLLDKRDIPSFEDSEEEIKKKIKRDSKSDRS